MQSTINIISWICVSQSLFIIIYLLIRHQKKADYLMCLIIANLGIAGAIKFSHAIMVLNACYPIIGIVTTISIYLFTKYITNEYKHFWLKDLLHFILPVIMTIMSVAVGWEVRNKNLSTMEITAMYPISITFCHYFFFASLVIYYVASFFRIRQFRMQIADTYSFQEEQLQLRWLIAFMIAFLIYNLLNTISAIFHYNGYSNVIPNSITTLFTLVMIYLLSFGGIMQKQLVMAGFKEKDEDVMVRPDTNISKPTSSITKSMKSSYNNQKNREKETATEAHEDEMEKLSKELIDYIEANAVWKDCELSITKLSRGAGIPKYQITQILNEHIGKNFYTLINGYRIEEAKRMITNEQYKNYTFIAIAMDCGFNSKTTFYTTFKKITGTTPTEYKNRIIT